jgi:hypothetical protein
MLLISLFLSLLLFTIAHVAVRRRGGWVWAFFVCGISFSFGTMCLGLFFLPVLIAFVLLAGAWPPEDRRARRRKLFPAFSVAALAVAFGLAGWLTVAEQRHYTELREQFPYESMEGRASVPPPAALLPDAADKRLKELERTLPERGDFRTIMLRRLHEDQVGQFINSSGFGRMRVIRPTKWNLTASMLPEKPVSQPGLREAPVRSAGGDGTQSPTPEEDLYKIHWAGVEDFVNAAGFGYVKDRQHVAGFQAHQFHELPGPAGRWHVRTLDLVGLLVSDEPRAYVSADLPRMDELRAAPTRPLDTFEAAALEKLRRGEDLVVEGAPTKLRMLGSVRSAKQCVQCHGGNRGDLLGAFSYALQPGE